MHRFGYYTPIITQHAKCKVCEYCSSENEDSEKWRLTVLCWRCVGSHVGLHQGTHWDTAAVSMERISASPVNQQFIRSRTLTNIENSTIVSQLLLLHYSYYYRHYYYY